ncbi:NUDIX hydrolase domain-like protein [Thamnocephalis sphaerospora]|uniref:Large ribosomal subunit protein mL46 n=1 Tax=Thamnocephalis sphaerospora TaxID=78915 RepID=A0A4P9XW61_9FUNG|nr:NUDIX hydrolase domain-like protein [Thamnocephalis sphaerospora]|eukprot:RKP09650.1 NUDIX hydrolase domain-like protein [Thamnocephalis sphaerospora]
MTARALSTAVELKTPRIVASAIVSRLPQITREPTSFEHAYHQYREAQASAKAAPVPVDFYFKKGSEAERTWQQRERGELSEAAWAQLRAAGDGQPLELAGRVSKADQEGDRRSLDRALQRTLYLVVKRPRDRYQWQFPQGGVEAEEALHDAGRRELAEECGPDMDIWFVGRRPVGFTQYAYPTEHTKKFPEHDGAKVFFLRAHIFAGQAKVDGKETVDFAWLTKEELSEVLEPDYFNAVADILPTN